jgi:hypothetical protein
VSLLCRILHYKNKLTEKDRNNMLSRVLVENSNGRLKWLRQRWKLVVVNPGWSRSVGS